jgi:hypothetical protein
MKRRVEMFRAGHVPPGTPTLKLVDDLWEEYERVIKQLRKIRARAMAEGKRFGRKPKLTKHQARQALTRVAAGETLREIVE